MMTNTNKSRTIFEVWGVTRFGGWEYQSGERTSEDAERICRVIRDGYAQVVVREVAA